MQGSILVRALVGTLVLFVSSCSLSTAPSDYSRISIRIANDPVSSAPMRAFEGLYMPFGTAPTGTPSGTPTGGGNNNPVQPPATISGFDCLAINVMGFGIPPTAQTCGCTDPNNCTCNQGALEAYALLPENLAGQTFCAYPGVTSNPIPNTAGTKELDMSVPTGPQRIVEIVGIMDPSNDVCNTGVPVGTTNDKGTANYYEIGRDVIDLFASQAVTLPDTFDTLNAQGQLAHQLNCNGPGNGGYISSTGNDPTVAVYWPMNETTIGIANYRGTEGNLFGQLTTAGTSVTGPLTGPASSGQNFALQMNTASDGATGALLSPISFTDFSVEFWINIPNGQNCQTQATIFQLFTSVLPPIGGQITITCSGTGSLGVTLANNSDQSGSNGALVSINDGAWHDVILSWANPSPGVPSFFIDGVDQTGSGVPFTFTGGFVFQPGGTIDINQTGANPLPAGTMISNVAIYDVALTAGQAAAHFSLATK
jgi:hypothetical protein